MDLTCPCNLGKQGQHIALTKAVEQEKPPSTLTGKMQNCARWKSRARLSNAVGHGDNCWPLNRERLRQLLRDADGLLPNSWFELQALRNDLQWDGDCFEIVATMGRSMPVSGC